MKKHDGALLTLALLLPIIALGATGVPVSAQTSPCIGTIGKPVSSGTQYYPSYTAGYMNYYPSNIQITVNVSANCSSINGPLTARGRLYDLWTHSYVGSANVILTPTNSTYYKGQLAFYIEPEVGGHTLVLSVSIYNYGISMGTGALIVNPPNYQGAYYDCTNPNQYNSTQYSDMNWYAYCSQLA